VLSRRGLCDGLITRPEESYRLWCAVVCDLETSNTRRLKPATGLWKYNHNGLWRQENKQTNKTDPDSPVPSLVFQDNPLLSSVSMSQSPKKNICIIMWRRYFDPSPRSFVTQTFTFLTKLCA
jgi:hypothetical protein